MLLARRSILAGMLAAPTAAALAKTRAAAGKTYRDMLVIDGLGGISDPYSPEDAVKLSARSIAEMKASGVNAINVTIHPVGNAPGGWEQML
ncbi:MAG: hypothetical protein ABL914_12390, partial [Novosphingobium sp.]|uniref:hypothetical protein n=1 Tax=Novosphingobium sp. TaxID=1874826 RepID=UPI0032BC290D